MALGMRKAGARAVVRVGKVRAVVVPQGMGVVQGVPEVCEAGGAGGAGVGEAALHHHR